MLQGKLKENSCRNCNEKIRAFLEGNAKSRGVGDKRPPPKATAKKRGVHRISIKGKGQGEHRKRKNKDMWHPVQDSYPRENMTSALSSWQEP